MQKQHIELSSEHREKLSNMLRHGSLKSRTYKRITALLCLDKGQTYKLVSETTHQTVVTVRKLASNYKLEGLACLYDAPRSGRPIKITAEQRDQITVLSCSEVPEGYGQWSVRLLADQAVELGYCEEICPTTVHTILKKEAQAALD